MNFRSPVIHPLLFTIFPILALFNHNIEQLPFQSIMWPLIIAPSIVLLAWFSLTAKMKNRGKAGVLLTFLIFSFFSYGHVVRRVNESILARVIPRSPLYPFIACLLIIIAVTILIIRSRWEYRELTAILNLTAVTMTILSAANMGYYYVKYRRHASSWTEAAQNAQSAAGMAASTISKTRPDIYYIILDRYGNASTLQEYFDFGNNDFTRYLSHKGFFVASKSCCNYATTFLSLASSLNMRYVNDLKDSEMVETKDRSAVYETLQDFEVLRLLKARGYRYLHFGSSWEPTRLNRFADENYNYYRSYFGIPLNEFSRKLLTTTLLQSALDIMTAGTTTQVAEYRGRLLFQFDKLAEVVTEPGPKFVFAHIFLPHPPYLFNRDGKAIYGYEGEGDRERQDYIEYVMYGNQKIRVLVNSILKRSAEPPIIILQADEGPRLKMMESLNLKRLDRLRFRARIFNAYYVPGMGDKSFYKSISPVNTFRLIFNGIFGTQYPILDDKTFYASDPQHPYQFQDITNFVKFK